MHKLFPKSLPQVDFIWEYRAKEIDMVLYGVTGATYKEKHKCVGIE